MHLLKMHTVPYASRAAVLGSILKVAAGKLTGEISWAQLVIMVQFQLQ